MARRRCFIGPATATIIVIGIWLLGAVPQATAETLNAKLLFNHFGKTEIVPIADVDGHFISLVVREGVVVLENGEFAQAKQSLILDLIKGEGTAESHLTCTFSGGSTFKIHTRGRVQTTPQGVISAVKWIGDIIDGTGRFQGIKGTLTSSTNLVLPTEKGQPLEKALSEATLVYTLPSK